jgi:site-specific DNA-methyltransferase (adenine-specific)
MKGQLAMGTTDLIVARVESACRMLAEAKDALGAKRAADVARAAELYARLQGLPEEAIAYVTAVKVDATTLMGEYLKAGPKNEGHLKRGPVVPNRNHGELVPPPTLAELGISKKQSAQAQALATVKEKAPELHARIREGKAPIAKACQELARAKREDARRELAKAAPPAKGQPAWRVIEGDCLSVLPTIQTGTVRLAFADPPYNIGVDYGAGVDRDLLPPDAFAAWLCRWVEMVKGLLTFDGSLWVLMGDEYAAEARIAIKRAGLPLRNWIKWYERFGVNCADKFNRTSRHLFYAVRDEKDYVFNRDAVSRPSDRQAVYGDARASPAGKVLDDVWDDIPRLAGTHVERIPGFPTQLPLALLRRVVLCASNPGDLVLDPFNGSGTTGAAAIALGRRYIGVEKSAAFAALARERLSKVRRETP